MIINIYDNKKKFYQCTIDIRCRQIRVLKTQFGIIDFIDISRDDADAFDYLFKNNKKLFLKTLKDYVNLDFKNVDMITNGA